MDRWMPGEKNPGPLNELPSVKQDKWHMRRLLQVVKRNQGHFEGLGDLGLGHCLRFTKKRHMSKHPWGYFVVAVSGPGPGDRR